MIIEDPEAFKSWLTTILEPLCDADPAALAKYVYALVKKDKPIPELRESMLSQLEVFLLTETVNFVNMLFEKLLNENKEPSTSCVPESVSVAQSSGSVPSTASGSLSTLSGSISGSVSGSLSESLETTPVKVKMELNQDKSSVPPDAVVDTTEVEPVAESNSLDKDSKAEREAKEKEERDREKERIERERELKEIREREVKERELEKQMRENRVREREKDHRERDDDARTGVQGAPGIKDALPLSNGQASSSLATTPGKRDVERRSPHRIRDRNKSDSEKDDRPINMRSSRPSRRASSPRFRSRSRSWEQRHSRRSRSRDRERDRSRAWRNKSPPPRRYDRDRRRSWTKSPVRRDRVVSRSRSRSRSRSPISSKFRSARYRNRSPPLPHSPSVSPRRAMRFDSDPLSGPATPTQDSNHEPDLRLNLASQSIQSVVSVKDQPYTTKKRCRDFDEKGFCMRGDLCPFDHGSDPVVLEDVALPQVLSSYQTNNLAPMPAAGTDLMVPQDIIRPPVNLPVPPNNLPVVMNQIIRPQHIRPQLNSANEYNPDAPSMEPRMMWGRPPFRPPAVRGITRSVRGTAITSGPGVYTNYMTHQRELVNVPVESGNMMPYPHGNDFQNNMNNMNAGVNQRRMNFDYTRLGGARRGGMMGNKVNIGHPQPQDNCSLELKKIPRGINNITHLNNHFAKFGKIVNIQVGFEGDPEAALITFSSHAEANAAYKSTEAVLNNRFIKVFWHNMEGKQENVPPRRPSVKERLGAPVSTPAPSKVLNTLQPSAVQTKEEKPSSDKVVYSGLNLTKTMYIPTALKKSENLQITTVLPQEKKPIVTRPTAFKKTQEIRVVKETLKKKQEEKRKEAIKLTADLRKRKQELLDKQLKEQKLLIERLEKGGVLPEQRDSIINTLKILQQSIEKLRKDLASVVTKMNVVKSSSPVKVTPEMVKKTREETQRQILDAELDIFNQQQEGKDTTDLQKRVLELKMRAKTLGLLGNSTSSSSVGGSSSTAPSHYASRGKFRTSCARTAFPHASVDRRPTKLLVSNCGKLKKTDVLAHFAQFGEIVEYDFDDGADSLVLTFKSRKEAENAFSKGPVIGDCQLNVSWFTENQTVRHDNNNVHRSIVLMCGEGEEEEEVDELLEGAEEDGDELQLEELGEELLFNEEEEEDEERSWRR